MGDIAEDMINGTCCDFCGQYFKDTKSKHDELFTHGFPVVCWDCWNNIDKRDKKHFIRANMPTL